MRVLPAAWDLEDVGNSREWGQRTKRDKAMLRRLAGADMMFGKERQVDGAGHKTSKGMLS